MYRGVNISEGLIGETLINIGFMSEKSVNIVLLRQEFGDNRLFGQIATTLNLLSDEKLSEFLNI